MRYDSRGFFFSRVSCNPCPSERSFSSPSTNISAVASVKEKGCILLFFARQPNCRAISRLIGYRSIFGASLSAIQRSRVWQGIYQPCPGADKCINSFLSCSFHGIREIRHFNGRQLSGGFIYNPPAACFSFVSRSPIEIKRKERR